MAPKIYALLSLILLMRFTQGNSSDENRRRTGGHPTRDLGEIITSDRWCEEKEDQPGFWKCSGPLVTEVPQDLDRNIIGIELSSNRIPEILDSIFKNYTKLETIILDSTAGFSNRLKIAEGAFRELPHLTSLSILNCYMEDEDFENRTFDNLVKLKSLTMAHTLTKLPTDLLKCAPNLESLSISDCELNQLNSKAFKQIPNLKTLDLHQNNIKQLDSLTFKHLRNLTVLDLRFNQITQLDPSVFEHVPNLTILSLGYNPGLNSNISNTLISLQYLEDLSLAACDLTTLNGSAFSMNNPVLKKLDITHNKFVCDCHATWMAQAIVDGEVWALDWQDPAGSTQGPDCYPSIGGWYWIDDLYPQDLTCDEPHIKPMISTDVERESGTTVPLKALVTKGFPSSTWVLPDGSTHKADQVFIQQVALYTDTDRVVGKVVDEVSNKNHSVNAWCEVSSLYNGTGHANFTLMASTLAGQSANLTFSVYTYPPTATTPSAAADAGGPPVCTLLLVLLYTMLTKA